MFNFPHLHLMFAHFPIVLIPVGAVLLLLGIIRKEKHLETTSLWFFIFGALICIPVFLIGEEAGEAIEHLPGIIEKLIEEHEEAAEGALWASCILGAMSVFTLIFRGRDVAHILLKGALVISIVSSILLANAANQGGKIRHPEAYQTTNLNHEE